MHACQHRPTSVSPLWIRRTICREGRIERQPIERASWSVSTALSPQSSTMYLSSYDWNRQWMLEDTNFLACFGIYLYPLSAAVNQPSCVCVCVCVRFEMIWYDVVKRTVNNFILFKMLKCTIKETWNMVCAALLLQDIPAVWFTLTSYGLFSFLIKLSKTCMYLGDGRN